MVGQPALPDQGPFLLLDDLGSAEAARRLLVAGRPLRELVAKEGPFVMNFEDEPRRAFADCQAGRL